jgi:hypothetical protein
LAAAGPGWGSWRDLLPHLPADTKGADPTAAYAVGQSGTGAASAGTGDLASPKGAQSVSWRLADLPDEVKGCSADVAAADEAVADVAAADVAAAAPAPCAASAAQQLSPLEQLQLLKQREEVDRKARKCSGRGGGSSGRLSQQLKYTSSQHSQRQGTSLDPRQRPGIQLLLRVAALQQAAASAAGGLLLGGAAADQAGGASPPALAASDAEVQGQQRAAGGGEGGAVVAEGGGVAERGHQPRPKAKALQLKLRQLAAARQMRSAEAGPSGRAAALRSPSPSGDAALRMLQRCSLSDLQRACPVTAAVLMQRCASGRPELLGQVLAALLR